MAKKKDQEFVCCQKCVEFLGKKSTSIVMIWLEMCAAYLDANKPIVAAPTESNTLEFLEKNGFIVTTDAGENVLIVPQGYHHEPDWNTPDFFCVNPSKHARFW